MSSAPLVALAGIRLARAPGFALDVPALEIEKGQVLAVIGPNGSGKSTLLRVIGLIEAPDEGDVRLNGRSVQAAHALTERRTMATVNRGMTRRRRHSQCSCRCARWASWAMAARTNTP